MQMIGSLASGIAHNFNNIISAILGYSEMIEPQLARGTKAAQHIDEIRRAAERGRDLIDNILTFGRQRDACVRPVQVRTLFEEAAALLRASLPSGVVLVIEDVPADVAVSGEPAQLQQVIPTYAPMRQAMQTATDPHHRNRRKWPGAVDQPRRALRAAVCWPSSYYRGFDESVARRLSNRSSRPSLAGTDWTATVHEIVRDHDGG
jgi:hypothetical protein